MHGNMVQPTIHVGTAASAVRPREARLKQAGSWHACRPEPRVILGNGDQTATDGIVQNVRHLLVQFFRRSQYPIEGLGLPHLTYAPQRVVDLMSRSALDRIHDFCKGKHLICCIVDQGRKYEVHMIGHDDGGVKVDLCSVVMQTTSKCNRTRLPRKDPSQVSAEGYKVWLVIALKMWKLASVEWRRHKKSRRDSRPRLSGGENLR